MEQLVFKNIVSTINESILLLDNDLKIIFANDAFSQTFKVSRERTVGSRIYDAGNKQWDIPALHVLLKRTLLKGKKSFKNFKVTHAFPGIGHRTMLLNGRILLQRRAKKPLILLVIEDITLREKAESRLIVANRLSALGQVSLGIAHGFSSPLTGLGNFLSAYHKQSKKGTQQRKELALMLEGCRYMASIIDILSLFAGKSRL